MLYSCGCGTYPYNYIILKRILLRRPHRTYDLILDFCTMYEYGDAASITFLSELSRSVAQLAGQKKSPFVASQRDEPGISRAAIPVLVSQGVTALSIGLDWASPPPQGMWCFNC